MAKLARYLDPDRFEPHVGCFLPSGERRAELDAAHVPILHLPVRSLRNRTALDGARVLRSYLRRHNIQLLHAFDAPTSIYAVPLARLFRVPVVLSSHLYFRFLTSARDSLALRVVDHLAHRIVVNSQAVRNHLMEDFHIPAERLFVAYNGVETDAFFPRPEAPPPFLRDASLVIGSLCVLREEKRLELLLEAFAKVRQREPRMRLLIVGDGYMREKWMALRDALGLAETCRFETSTSNVPFWMRCMDVFVLPSRSEGFPNSLLEAMACGCAAVASNVGGIPELVEDGRTGLLFRSGDSSDLARQLAVLIENPELRRQLGAAAAVRARECFSMETAARRMRKFYDSLLVAGRVS